MEGSGLTVRGFVDSRRPAHNPAICPCQIRARSGRHEGSFAVTRGQCHPPQTYAEADRRPGRFDLLSSCSCDLDATAGGGPGRVRLLYSSPGQYGDVDVLAEMLVRGHGPADLVGEGWSLVWGGQLGHREGGVDAADELVEV
jgi:hypothetical protein